MSASHTNHAPNQRIGFTILILALLVCLGQPIVAQSPRHPIGAVRTIGTTTVRGVDILLNPAFFAVRPDGFVVYDAGDNALKKVRFDGRLLWRQGREGAGPGEYRHVVDLHLGPSGLIALLDEGNVRVSLVSDAGHHIADRRVSQNVTKIMKVVSVDSIDLLDLRDWRIAGLGESATGSSSMWLPRPSDQLLLSEAMVQPRDGEGQAVVFRWNSLLGMRAGGATTQFMGVDSITTPTVITRKVPGTKLTVRRVDPSAREVAWAVARTYKCVAILGREAVEDGAFHVDFYGERGNYLGTHRLNGDATHIDLVANTLYILFLDPRPAIMSLELPKGTCG